MRDPLEGEAGRKLTGEMLHRSRARRMPSCPQQVSHNNVHASTDRAVPRLLDCLHGGGAHFCAKNRNNSADNPYRHESAPLVSHMHWSIAVCLLRDERCAGVQESLHDLGLPRLRRLRHTPSNSLESDSDTFGDYTAARSPVSRRGTRNQKSDQTHKQREEAPPRAILQANGARHVGERGSHQVQRCRPIIRGLIHRVSESEEGLDDADVPVLGSQV